MIRMMETFNNYASRVLRSLACLMMLAVPARGETPAQPAPSVTLDAILALAEERNPTLAAFLANVEASQGEAVTARAYPNPTTNLTGGRGESRGVSPEMARNEYQATFIQPLEWPFKRESRIQAARSKVETTRLDAEGFRLFLRAEVKDAFYRVLLADKQVELAVRNLETVRDLRRSVEIRVKTGEAPAFELVKADVELLKAQNEVAKRRSQVELARAALNALLGNVLPKSFTVVGEFSSPKTWPDPPVLIERAMETYPTVVRQRREVERWRYQLGFERQARVPDVGVGGLYLRDVDKETFGVVLSVPLPIWDQRQGKIATAMAEGRRAEADMERSRTELTKAITQEFQNYRIAAEQLAVFETGLLKQAEEALRIAQISFRQGASGLLDLLDAQRVQRATLQEYYGALYDLSAAQAQLERVTGLGEF
jgi:cobalt-zinc-cadmium efflux system outer membrane protein